MKTVAYKAMDDNQLAAIASALGVEAEAEVVRETLVDLVKMLDEPAAAMMEDDDTDAMQAYAEDEDSAKADNEEDEDASKADEDPLVSEMKRVLGVKSRRGVAQRLVGLYMSIRPQRMLNLDALKAATDAARNTAPAARDRVQPVTPREASAAPRRPEAKKSQHYSFAIGGRAQKPTLGAMVADLHAGKAHNYELGPLGGYVVSQEIREELIPVLRAQMVLEQAGVRVTELPDNSALTLPKMRLAPDAYWVGINEQIPEDDALFDTITLVPKPVAARTRIPKRMLATMFADAETRINEEIIRSIRLKIEAAALFGTGAQTGSNNGGEPLGLLNTTGVTTTSLGTNGGIPKADDLIKMFERIEIDNVEVDETARYIMNPRDYGTVSRLTDTTGQPLMRESFQGSQTRQVDGKEVLKTTQIPTNVTTGTASNTSYIFAGVWRFMELAFGGGIEIQVLNELYADRLQVGIIAHTYADMAVHYTEAFEILSGVKPS